MRLIQNRNETSTPAGGNRCSVQARVHKYSKYAGYDTGNSISVRKIKWKIPGWSPCPRQENNIIKMILMKGNPYSAATHKRLRIWTLTLDSDV